MNNLSHNANNPVSTMVSPEVTPSGPVSLLPKLDLVEIFNALRRRLWIVIACALLAVVLMAAYVSTLPVLYASHGSVHVKTEAPQVFDIKPIAQEESRDLEQMRTVADGLGSSTVLLDLVEKNDLASDTDFAKPGIGQNGLVEIMRSRVGVELRRGTRLIDISVEDTDPERAALLVEELVRAYEEQKDLGHSDLIDRVSAGLENEEKRLRLKMEESDALVNKFRAENALPGLLTIGSNGESINDVAMMNKELVAAKTARIRLQSEYEAFQKLDASDPDALSGLGKVEQSDLLMAIQSELRTKEVGFARIKERYLYKHPVYIEADNEIKSLKKSLEEVATTAGETLKKRYELAVEHEKRLLAALSDEKGEAVDEESIRHAFAKLSRQAQIDRELHASVAKRLRETQIGSSWTGSFLRWEDRPLKAEWPSKPRKKVLIAASFVMGSMLGLFLAVLAELLDRRVRESAAVERAIGVPALVSLPHFTREALDELGAIATDSSPASAPARLSQFVFPQEQVVAGKSSMLFTSAFKNDGKSVSALKCARTFARQGHRTLLIDADFHDGGLSRGYTETNEGKRHGLAAYLRGVVDAERALFETGSPGMWFVPTGAVEGDTSELLSKPEFRKLLDALAPMFDRIVVDASSVVDDSDVQSLVRHVDAVSLVVRKNVGRYRDLKGAAEILRSAGARLVGFVWNEVDRTSGASLSPEISPNKPAGNLLKLEDGR